MVAEGQLGLLEPGEDAAVALVQRAIGRADAKARHDLVDQLPLLFGREGGRDLRIIQDARRDQRLVAARLVGTKRAEVRQARDGVHQSALLPPAQSESGRYHQDGEQRRGDIDEQKCSLRRQGQEQQ